MEDSPFAGARLATIDGLRADFPDGWGLLRASNTTPVLVLRFEANDEAALERIKTMFREQLQPLLPGVDLGF
ncbi:Phosphomannomutase/phosphoglucomutase [compost metagenome]